MTDYFVRISGDDGDDGLSPATAWATIGKALGASGITWGDTVYIGAGVYREAVAVALYEGHTDAFVDTVDTSTTIGDTDGVLTQADVGFTITGSGIPGGTTLVSVVDGVSAVMSQAATATDEPLVQITPPALETFVVGDTDGSQTGDAGEVRLTNWVVNDTTEPTDPALLPNGRSHLTFRRLRIVGSVTVTGSAVGLDPNGSLYSSYLTFSECSIRGFVNGGNFVLPFGINSHWLFDRCFMFSTGEVCEMASEQDTGADFDVGVAFRNCVMVCAASGSAQLLFMDANLMSIGGRPGGLQFENCTLVGGRITTDSGAGALSTTIPMTITNCRIVGTALVADNAGEIVEDYNVFVDGRSQDNANVSEGANSIISANLMSIGDERVWGAAVRAFGVPGVGDPALGFGGNNPPAVDILDAPRPAGGESNLAAVGAYERGNTFTRETGTVRSGSNAISITGPGYQDFHVRVDAVETTVSVWVRWDSTYTGTKPKLQILNGGECGVADDEDTAVGGADSWEQLSLTFTPSIQGVVTVRFLSSDTDGGGKMFVDDLLRSP